jgi:hypothetical protein
VRTAAFNLPQEDQSEHFGLKTSKLSPNRFKPLRWVSNKTTHVLSIIGLQKIKEKPVMAFQWHKEEQVATVLQWLLHELRNTNLFYRVSLTQNLDVHPAAITYYHT